MTTPRRKTRRKAPPQGEPSEIVDMEPAATEEGDGGSISYDVVDDAPVTLFDNSPEDSYIVVKRLGLDKQWHMFVKLIPEEATEENLQELGGGGTYRSQERCPDDKGRFVFGRQRTIKIDGPRKELTSFPGTPLVPVADAPAVTEPGVDATQLANAETQRALLVSFLERESHRPEVERTDWGPVVISVLPAVLKYLVDSKSSQQAAPDPVELVTKIAAVFKENTSPTSAMKDQIDMMMSILDLKGAAKELEAPPTGETGDPLIDLIAANVPKVISLMEGQKAATSAAPTPPVATGAPVPASPVVGLPAITGEAPMWGTWLLSHKQSFVAMARDGKNPEICADSLLELMLPVALRGQLAEFLQKPDAMATTLKYIPELQQYEQWTADFLNRLFENLFGTAEVVDEGAAVVDEGSESLPTGAVVESSEGSIETEPTAEVETDVTREE